MLQPDNRLTLIDAMRPPSGFGLESAIGVTFTLDLRALLAAPAAFALTGADTVTDDGTHCEPIELLHAVRTHASKITVFSQVGEIALPPSRRVFAFLERSVVPVRAPLGGVVHPKVWVIRYTALDGPTDRRLRVLIGSRNLTFDASWDSIVRLDESATRRGASLAPLADLFEGLLANAHPFAAASEHADRVGSLAAALRDTRFALPPGVDGIRVDVRGFARTPVPLPATAERSLVIAPFVTTDFFDRVRPTSVDELVSRPESLDLLGEADVEHVRARYAFDDGSLADLGSTEDRLSPGDPGRPLVGLHAKVFAFENDGRAHVFLGSANATGAAFESNVEILVELIGTLDKLGIDRLCEGSDDERGLRSLFIPYTRSEPAMDGGEAGELDRGRHAIARMLIDGVVEESGSGWAVTYRSRARLPENAGATIACWPLASPGNRRPVQSAAPLDVRFETTLEAISGFLAFEIAAADGTLTEFVVPVPLTGVPQHRDRVLLKALVGNAERFLRYLLALLEEDPTQMEFLDVFDRDISGGGENGDGVSSLPVLEKLLRAMRRDPGKLIALHPLVADLAEEDALPNGFAELWTTLYDVGVGGSDRS